MSDRGERLVAAQIALLAAVAAAPRLDGRPVPGPVRAAGLVAVAVGGATALAGAAALGRGLTPWTAPPPRARLVETGPFAVARHPIYAGLVLMAAGRSGAGGSACGLTLTAALAALLRVKAAREERLLERRLPAYAAYRRRTPGALLPRPRRAGAA